MDVKNFIAANGLWRPQSWYFKHAHPWWEITFYTSGSGSLLAGDKEIPFEPGTVVCMPPHTPHKEIGKSPFTNCWVAIEKLETGDSFPVFEVPTEHPVVQLISILHVETQLQHDISQVVVQNVFNAFMAYLHEWLASSPNEQLVLRLRRTLIANLAHADFRVGDAMARVPMSRDHLRRLFKAFVGVGPKEYLTELRMARARDLLQLGTSVKQTADEVGIPDPYHFSRVFRRTHGISPSAYRKEHSHA